jgi:hypothetical protein
MRSSALLPKSVMSRPATHLHAAANPSLTALAEQLREGPLLHLLELQAQMRELTERAHDCPTSRVDELERLVRLSVSAMEHFNAFTREFASVLRDLVDDQRDRH